MRNWFVADERPWRCPVCWERTNKRVRWWRIYRCKLGHRWTRLPIPGRLRWE